LQVKLEITHRHKRKQIDLNTKEINWLIGKISHLSIENKLLIYRAVIKPIWSYGIEMWGCASKFNTVIMQRSQSKILRAIVNEPRYVTIHPLHTDFNIPYVVTLSTKESINITTTWRPIPIHYYSHYCNLQTPGHCRINTVPRHGNTLYRSVLCIIITLAYRLYSC
jgi:hypothetical protein